MKLSKLKESKPTMITVDLGGGDTITLTYDRAILTTGFSRELRPVAEKLAACLLSWDVTDDEGKPYQPPEKSNGTRTAIWGELFAPLPSDVIGALYNAIWDDVWAGKSRGGGS